MDELSSPICCVASPKQIDLSWITPFYLDHGKGMNRPCPFDHARQCEHQWENEKQSDH